MLNFLVWVCKFVCLCDIVMFGLLMADIIKDVPEAIKYRIKAKGTNAHTWIVLIGALIIFIVPIVNLGFAYLLITKSEEIKQAVLEELQKEYGGF